jgi:hypothetical protein
MEFNWTSFLLGLAIGLWIALVVLLLKPAEQKPIEVTVTSAQAGAGTQVYLRQGRPWIPGGSEVYRCTNNDHGAPIVEDHGGAIVDDPGAPIVDDPGAPIVDDPGAPIVDDPGAPIVDDYASANVPENAAHVPAPTSDLLGGDRGFREFYCATNRYGGAVVKSKTGRVVAVAIPGDEYDCTSVDGNATVTDRDGFVIQLDHGGAIVDDTGDVMGMADDISSFCMVARKDSDAVVVNGDGEQ